MTSRALAALLVFAALFSPDVFGPRPAAGSVSRRSSLPPERAAPHIETGELSGARFTFALPTPWNRRVLLLAPGARAKDGPPAGDFWTGQFAYKTLLDEGWLIAKTNYRRPGIIIADAIADLDALRVHLAAKYGALDRVVLEGESLGGLIVALMAEREPVLDEAGHPCYSGAIAIDAALQLREAAAFVGLSLEPKFPLLFVANQSEFDGPRNYVTAEVARSAALRPALLRVARNGHVNVNQQERLTALRALNAWLDRGRAALPQPGTDESGRSAASAPFADITVVPAPQPSQVSPHPDGRGFDARVTEVSAMTGTLTLNAQAADFVAAGIGLMNWFRLTANGEDFRVLNGRDFSSAKRGAWVAIPNADGFYWLGRNYADTAATAKLSAGGTVSIRRFDEVK